MRKSPSSTKINKIFYRIADMMEEKSPKPCGYYSPVRRLSFSSQQMTSPPLSNKFLNYRNYSPRYNIKKTPKRKSKRKSKSPKMKPRRLSFDNERMSPPQFANYRGYSPKYKPRISRRFSNYRGYSPRYKPRISRRFPNYKGHSPRYKPRK